MLPTPYAEDVLDLVARIPPGHVMTYGDVAGVAGGSGRSVGRVMSTFGSGVPWWRVIRADGWLPQGHEVEAARRLTAERVPFLEARVRVDLRRCRWLPEDVDAPKVDTPSLPT